MANMRAVHIIRLDILSTDNSEIRFLSAEINANEYTPFALVRYAIGNVERKTALRLDLDKRAFVNLHDYESEEFQQTACRVAPVIADRITISRARTIPTFAS